MTDTKPTRTTEAEKREIIRLRIEGHSLRAIASRTGRTTTTVSNVLKAYPVDIASLTTEALREAQESFKRTLDPEWLAAVAARQTIRLLQQTDELHQRVAMAMVETDPERFVALARGTTALSTALSNMARTYQAVLPMKQTEDDSEALPELVVKIMSDDDVRALRAQQKAEQELAA
ncbi:helix-turn-helix domain-containing protein [Parendozoicomonas haliclonae]|uniref:Uncharacterized protein n=1 Tax=Parendozoicomonas haliclonae TaxID=1960125 RepID=A0A1X7AH14_9GAMM|nr:helix-turn-helix domain-containing protein [Parendozoicomonas haliclonae]SMA40095.1 hypothetical protein EHSB41UT_01138 [Parendozoicomonas haliclonae]